MTLAQQYLDELRQLYPHWRLVNIPDAREYLLYVAMEGHTTGFSARLYVFSDESKLVINNVVEVVLRPTVVG